MNYGTSKVNCKKILYAPYLSAGLYYNYYGHQRALFVFGKFCDKQLLA